MKLLVEILIAIILHPVAVILVWLDLLSRSNLSGGKKLLWAVVALLWGIGPILYILLGDGELW